MRRLEWTPEKTDAAAAFTIYTKKNRYIFSTQFGSLLKLWWNMGNDFTKNGRIKEQETKSIPLLNFFAHTHTCNIFRLDNRTNAV